MTKKTATKSSGASAGASGKAGSGKSSSSKSGGQPPSRAGRGTRAPSASGPTRGVAFTACTAAGVGVFLSYPNFVGPHLYFLQWFALVPVIWVTRSRSLRASVGWWLWTGFITNIGGFYWIDYLLQEFGHLAPWISAPLTVVMTAYQGVVFGVAGWLSTWLERRGKLPVWLTLPAGFVVAETLIPLVFPWYMANGQFRFTWVAQIMDTTGVAGLSFFIVFTNAALYTLLFEGKRHRVAARKLAVALVVSWVLVLGYGAWRASQVAERTAAADKVRVGMIEANVGIWEKEAKSVSADLRGPTLLFNIIKHQRLSVRATQEQGAELLVWPESSYIPIGEVAIKRTDLFAVALAERGGLLEWRDGEWKAPAGGLPAGVAGKALRAVYVAHERDLWVGGESGVLLHHDGRAWSLSQGPDADIVAITGERRSDGLWAAGRDGSVFARSTSGWAIESKLPAPAVSLAFDYRRRSLWALTASGAVLAQGRASWTTPEGLPDGSWRAMSLGPGSLGALGGAGGRIALRTGRSWQSAQVSGLGDVNAVVVVSETEAYAAGQGGWASWDGTRWTRHDSPTPGALTAVGATEDGHLLLTAASGELASRLPDDADGEASVFTITKQADFGRFVAVAGVGFDMESSIPTDVAWFYRSRVPLPTGPDAATVYEQDHDTHWRDRTAMLRGFDAPVLFGAVLFEPPAAGAREGRVFNSALLVDRRGKVMGRYDKNYLLVFGEYIPGGDTFPVLYDWLPEASHFTAGQTVEAFDWAGHKWGVMICYEDILPRFTRRLADKGTHAILNITNDAWFGKTAEPYLHLALATARPIENRQWMVRSTNTGVSAFVDAAGRLVAETSLEGEETLVADVPLLEWTTPYQRIGDAFTYAVFLFVFGATGRALRRRRSRR